MLLGCCLSSLALANETPRLGTESERSWSLEARLGGGIDTNVLRDPEASAQAALVRVDVDSELQIGHRLLVNFDGWFEEHLPYYDRSEGDAQLLALYRRPLGSRFSLRLGSYGEYQRVLTTYVEGTVLIHGATQLQDLGEHVSVGFGVRLGKFDLELGGQGHLKAITGGESFNVYGIDGELALRWVPTQWMSLRLRYLFLFEDVIGLTLYDLDGVPVGFSHDLHVRTHQLDVTMRFRPIEPLDLFVRYELAAIEDNYVGYLLGQEHRVVAGLRFEPERHWTVDVGAKLVVRNYPLRHPAIDNQTRDLPFEVRADVIAWLHKSWGLYVRYELTGDHAEPFGLVFLRHTALAGITARTGVKW